MSETKRTFSPNKVCLIIATLGAIICVLIFVFASIGDTRTAEKTLKGISGYVKTQIIRYGEIVAETATDDLVAVADKTIEIREDLVARGRTEEYFKEIAEKKRLSGIITWSKEDDGYGGYLPENEGTETWEKCLLPYPRPSRLFHRGQYARPEKPLSGLDAIADFNKAHPALRPVPDFRRPPVVRGGPQGLSLNCLL